MRLTRTIMAIGAVAFCVALAACAAAPTNHDPFFTDGKQDDQKLRIDPVTGEETLSFLMDVDGAATEAFAVAIEDVGSVGYPGVSGHAALRERETAPRQVRGGRTWWAAEAVPIRSPGVPLAMDGRPRYGPPRSA